MVPVPEKIGPGKKYRYRYLKNFVPVPENSQELPVWMVLVPIPEKIYLGKKYRSLYQKKLVPEKVPVPEKIGLEKSTGTGIGKNWPRKKVLVPVPEKILGTVTAFKSQSRGPFYV